MKTYSISRKLNLARYGLPYESLDLTVEGCDTWAEAEQEIKAELERITDIFQPNLKKQLAKLQEKVRLTQAEEIQRQTLLDSLTTTPF